MQVGAEIKIEYIQFLLQELKFNVYTLHYNNKSEVTSSKELG